MHGSLGECHKMPRKTQEGGIQHYLMKMSLHAVYSWMESNSHFRNGSHIENLDQKTSLYLNISYNLKRSDTWSQLGLFPKRIKMNQNSQKWSQPRNIKLCALAGFKAWRFSLIFGDSQLMLHWHHRMKIPPTLVLWY